MGFGDITDRYAMLWTAMIELAEGRVGPSRNFAQGYRLTTQPDHNRFLDCRLRPKP
jgi:hypothetical protein